MSNAFRIAGVASLADLPTSSGWLGPRSVEQTVDREHAGERLGDLEPLLFMVPLVDAALPVGIDDVP